MDLSSQEKTKKMVQTKKEVLDTTLSHSEDNLNMESASCSSASTKNSIYYSPATDKNPFKYDANLIEHGMMNKKRKDNTEGNLKEKPKNPFRYRRNLVLHGLKKYKKLKNNIEGNFKEKPATAFKESDEISKIDENQSMHILKQNSPEVINMKNREVIRFSDSVLYPEIPSYSTSDKPLGCKTIFVSGLPQKITEPIIIEIFVTCGSLEAIRMQRKDCCYIRFNEESSVENAMCFSGYRLKIYDKNESPFSGILHVAYIKPGFDRDCLKWPQSENNSVIPAYPIVLSVDKTGTIVASYEICFEQQKNQPEEIIVFCTENDALSNNLEHSEGINQDDHIATSCICESLKNEENFSDGANVLMMWLENEECTKENANSFFTMMRCIHNHVLNIHKKKNKYEEQLKNAKGMLIEHLNKIMNNLSKIEKIYTAVLLQKWSNHFTSEQRKDFEQWQKYAEKLRSVIKEKIDEFERKIEVDEKHVKYVRQLEAKIRKLQESKNNLQQQCQEVQNKIATMDKNIAAIQRALEDSQREVFKLKRRCSMNEIQIKELYKIAYKKKIESNTILAEEARIIALASSFLQIWRGANIDSICFYLHEADPTINCGIVENLMRRFSTVFQEVVTGIGANMTKKWYLIGFQS